MSMRDGYGRFDEGSIEMEDTRYDAYVGRLYDIADVLSHGTRDDIRMTFEHSDPSEIDLAIGGTEDGDAGFDGSEERLQAVLEEMRRYGEETGDEAWSDTAQEIGANMIVGFGESYGRPSIGKVVKRLIGGDENGAPGQGKHDGKHEQSGGPVDVKGYDRVLRDGRRVHVKGYRRRR